jgi:glyoxylase-like metal-dependent hydrolase (beta-lactamase superfamily II)
MTRERELGRGERVLPGCWRLRLPTPMVGVPHVNAWALAGQGGLVLFDTGIHQPGSLAQLERALNDAGFAIDDVRLVVITHAHADHWGEAAPIRERTGCEVWAHPNRLHGVEPLEDPDAAFARRLQIARRCGLEQAALAQFEARIRNMRPAVAGLVPVDRELTAGVEIETDLGAWRVYETPGHAPSHVCLFEPERRLLIAGDHLLGRPSLYFDYGYTDDPVGEFLNSLHVIEPLDARLCMSGHGRTFTDIHAHIEDTRALVASHTDAAIGALRQRPGNALALAPAIFGERFTPETAIWRLTETLCYLRHLEAAGLIAREPESQRWRLLAGAGA